MTPEKENNQEQKENKNDDEKKEENHSTPSENNFLRNVDLVQPPCELETLVVKGVLNNINNNNLPKIPSFISPEEMEVTSMRVKIVCLEKTVEALKLEKKCVEMQIEAKEKVDKQKSRLVELLDAKVISLEKKNETLIKMVEDLINDKKARCNKMIEATTSMERLTHKLEESDKTRRELKASNDELKIMLSNMEEKGSKIAKLAKEKIIKYKDENIRIQEELDEYKEKKESDKDENEEWNQLIGIGIQLQEKIAAAQSPNNKNDVGQFLKQADVLNIELINKINGLQIDASVSNNKKFNEKENLLKEINHLKQRIEIFQDFCKNKSQDLASNSQTREIQNALLSLMSAKEN